MSDSLTNAVIVGVVITFFTVSVLVGIIIKQKQTIKEYETPRFGFLGKKLSAYLAGVMTLGVVGILAYPFNYTVPDSSISVADEGILTFDIEYELIDEQTKEYLITPVPYFDGIEWGKTEEIFDVHFIINGKQFYTDTISNFDRQGITVNLLDEIENSVHVTIFYRLQNISKEITITTE